MAPKPNALDRVLLSVAPGWALNRIRARAVAEVLTHRNYEAAKVGRRTLNWARRTSDANSAAAPDLSNLRSVSRDLVRNNAWARNGLRVITRNVVGWGIVPKAVGKGATTALAAAWKRWAGSTECDAYGRQTFSGLQRLVMRGVAESGEMLVRRRPRRPEDGLSIPLQLQVLEPDFIDTNKSGFIGIQGGPILNGIEYDAIGRRVAYWLFEHHPGSTLAVNPVSRRIAAEEVIHVFDLERAGQERGVPWFAADILAMKDFDEFEDAQLMRQKIAACFAGFVRDIDGGSGGLGEPSATDPLTETIEPGIMNRLPPGMDVTFSNPPLVTDDGFSVRTLRRIAAGIGVTYEDLTGDYSQVNFSSARMSRLAHWGNVYDWQWNMLVPQFCDPAWRWVMDAAAFAGIIGGTDLPTAEWTAQPMPMTEPDREARANSLMVRSGQKTLSQVIREQGMDPDTFLAEYAEDMAKLDAKGIILDSDARNTTQSGQTQAAPAAPGSAPADNANPAPMDGPPA